jgi:excisionase family DNA binding protein
MARITALEEAPSQKEERRLETELPSLLSPSSREGLLSSLPHGIEGLLTTKEASQILKIHPKVLERMAKRGEVPALKVGKFWRYRATALDAWINSRLQSKSQVCRIATSF